jgi:hypothetical protein
MLGKRSITPSSPRAALDCESRITKKQQIILFFEKREGSYEVTVSC